MNDKRLDSPNARSSDEPSARGRPHSEALRVTLVAVLASSLLAAVKIVAGSAGHSYALIADGVESILDVVSSIVVWGSLSVSALPPDKNHPYGHGKAESLGALAISTALLAAAVGIAIESVHEILTPHTAPARFTLFVLVGVVVTKEVLFRYLSRTASRLGSRVLETDAWHHRSDAITSAAAFLGISIAWIGGPGFESADDWAALLACGVIAFNGVRLFRGALSDIMDSAPAPETIDEIRRVAGAVAGVEDVEKCRVRTSGTSLLVDIHVEVDGDLPVRDGHRIGHDVQDALVASDLAVADVIVHIEPSDEACSDVD